MTLLKMNNTKKWTKCNCFDDRESKEQLVERIRKKIEVNKARKYLSLKFLVLSTFFFAPNTDDSVCGVTQ